MKSAYLLSVFPKLSESFVLNEITEQLKSNSEILIFSMNKPTEKITHEEVQEYNLLEKTHYFSLNGIFKINTTKFIINFIRTIFYEVSNLRIPANSFKIAYFATIMEENGVTQVHTHFATMGIYAKELGDLLKIPYTLTAHAYDIYVNPKADKLKNIMENAAAVITISEYNKNYLKYDIGVENRIDVIRCGINGRKFNPRKTSKKEQHPIKILTVSRFVEKKGIEYLIKSIPLVLKEIPNCEFIVVGSGPLMESLQDLAKRLNVDSVIKFKGDVSDSDLLNYYNDADMFVLPCIVAKNGDRDGIPVAMMEAMALEIPLISTNVSGIPELVEDGISGILVPPKDEKAISEAVIKLCKNEDLRIQMGKKGREIVLEKYNIKNETKKLEVLFEEISLRMKSYTD